ncbi:hypothetical protein DPSP01_014612 [Paraphaeosphaeria sporulosa]
MHSKTIMTGLLCSLPLAIAAVNECLTGTNGPSARILNACPYDVYIRSYAAGTSDNNPYRLPAHSAYCEGYRPNARTIDIRHVDQKLGYHIELGYFLTGVDNYYYASVVNCDGNLQDPVACPGYGRGLDLESSGCPVDEDVLQTPGWGDDEKVKDGEDDPFNLQSAHLQDPWSVQSKRLAFRRVSVVWHQFLQFLTNKQ